MPVSFGTHCATPTLIETRPIDVPVLRDRKPFDRAAHRFGHDQAAFQPRLRKKRDELFTAVPAEEISGAPQTCGRGGRDRTQTLIAGAMSVRVVVEFEVIDVEHHERERAAVTARARPLARDRLIERAPVRYRRERVGEREALELFRAHAALFVVQSRAEIDRARFEQRHVVGIERSRRADPQIAQDESGERDRYARRRNLRVLLAVLVRPRLAAFDGVPDAYAGFEGLGQQRAQLVQHFRQCLLARKQHRNSAKEFARGSQAIHTIAGAASPERVRTASAFGPTGR